MIVHFYGTMRDKTGQEMVELDETRCASVSQLFAWLFETYPEIQNELIDPAGRVYAQIPVFVNGRNPRLKPDGFSLPLGPQDVISLFSPISSGKMNVEVMQKASRK